MEALGSGPLVVITDTHFDDDDIERSELAGCAQVRRGHATSDTDVVAESERAIGLLVQWAPISASVFESLPDLRFVVRYGVGLDNIDLSAAERHGVVVRNVGDYCTDEVALHTVAMIVARARRLTVFHQQVREGGWRPDLVESSRPADEEAVGVAGLGRIGSRVAEHAACLGYPVLYWDPYLEPGAQPAAYKRVDTLVELAECAAHLSLHVPSTSETAGMIGAAVIEALGPSGHLVNTARGSLVDEELLVENLDAGRLGWASLDVLATEPPRGISARLATHPRVTVTPHVAYRSTRSPLKLRRRAAATMRSLIEESSAHAAKASKDGG